jgi:hypothetical protein
MTYTPAPKAVEYSAYSSQAPSLEEIQDEVHRVAFPLPPLVPHITMPAENWGGASTQPEVEIRFSEAPLGRKFDGAKARVDLVPLVAIDALDRYLAWKDLEGVQGYLDIVSPEGFWDLHRRYAAWRRWGDEGSKIDFLALLLGSVAETYADGGNIYQAFLKLFYGTAEVLAFGAKKYADNNWQHVPNGPARYLSALFRHLYAYQNGELEDIETGLSHLTHSACNLCFLLAKRYGCDEDFTLGNDRGEAESEEAAAE